MNMLKKFIIKSIKTVIYCILLIRIHALQIKHFIVYKNKKKFLIDCIARTKFNTHLASKRTYEYCKQPGLLQPDLSEKSVHLRIKFIIFGFSLIFIILPFRLIYISTNLTGNVKIYSKDGDNFRLDITDRNNELLAVNLPTASLFINPRLAIEPKESLDKLSKILPGIDKKKLIKKIKEGKSFAWVKRDLTPKEHQDIFNLGLPGFYFQREQKRVYTYGNLFSHIIGYVGRDLNGLAGAEKYFDKFLSNKEEVIDRRAMNGKLTLSLDARLQNILHSEMTKTMKKFSAKGASGIIADPNNGEILAMVSLPDFNPHNPGSAKPEQLFNSTTQGVYEVGSGMKSLTIAIGFDSGTTKINDAYNLSYMKVNGFQVRDYHSMSGWHSVPHIFLKSSNIGVGQIMLAIGKKNLQKYLKDLNLLDKLKIELPEKGKPIYPRFADWTDLALTTMSYGYGISESPAHFVQGMIPVVNGGTFYPLTIVKIKDKKYLKGRKVFKKQTSDDMLKLLRLVVAKGTGSKAKIPGYYVGGKTGTANIAVNGRYDKNKRISSFVGVLPATKPKFLIYVVFNEPKGIKETYGFAGGGWTGAPTVQAVFKKLIALYGIKQIDPNSTEATILDNTEYKIQNET